MTYIFCPLSLVHGLCPEVHLVEQDGWLQEHLSLQERRQEEGIKVSKLPAWSPSFFFLCVSTY